MYVATVWRSKTYEGILVAHRQCGAGKAFHRDQLQAPARFTLRAQSLDFYWKTVRFPRESRKMRGCSVALKSNAWIPVGYMKRSQLGMHAKLAENLHQYHLQPQSLEVEITGWRWG
jgi:hypothetical protein